MIKVLDLEIFRKNYFVVKGVQTWSIVNIRSQNRIGRVIFTPKAEFQRSPAIKTILWAKVSRRGRLAKLGNKNWGKVWVHVLYLLVKSILLVDSAPRDLIRKRSGETRKKSGKSGQLIALPPVNNIFCLNTTQMF